MSGTPISSLHGLEGVVLLADFQIMADAGKDLSSSEFVSVVDEKLAELGALRLSDQPPAFGIIDADRARLARAAREELATVVRIDEPPFDLNAVITHFDKLWRKRGGV